MTGFQTVGPLRSFLSLRPNFSIAMELVVLILKGSLAQHEVNYHFPVEEALLWRPPTCNLCCCPLCGGDGVSPTWLYWHLSCFWKAPLYTEHRSILLMVSPIGLPIFLILLPLFCLSFVLLLSVSVSWLQYLTGTKSSSSSLLWTCQDVLTSGLIGHHA